VCAGELAALGYAVTVFDERDEVGGLVRYAIAPYRQVQEIQRVVDADWESLSLRCEGGVPA
jgi:NADPH-dependent glutamate synthase beta subunit-like oxidoreductase